MHSNVARNIYKLYNGKIDVQMMAWYTCWGREFGEQVTDFPTRWTPNATHEEAEKQFKKYVISSKSVADALKN